MFHLAIGREILPSFLFVLLSLGGAIVWKFSGIVFRFLVLIFIYLIELLDMCEFDTPSFRCAVTGDFCRQLDGLKFLACDTREFGFTIFDYSQFIDYFTGLPYPRPSPSDYDWARDTYLECPF